MVMYPYANRPIENYGPRPDFCPRRSAQETWVGPGSILEWDESNGQVVVRRAGRHTSTDIHEALFGDRKPKTPTSVKEGIRKHMREKHARG